jgi:two-component system response regulator MtrA
MVNRRSKVLLVDPDAGIRRLIRRRLRTYGCICTEAATLPETLAIIGRWRPDAMIVGADLTGPESAQGLGVLGRIRAVAADVPLLCLVAQTMIDCTPLLLDNGADDCLVKPFLASELGARLHRLLHRQDMSARAALLDGTPIRALKLVPQGGYVETDQKKLVLTARQVSILGILIKADGAVVRSADIIEAVWGNAYAGSFQSLHRVIALLRQRIEPDPAKPRLIVTVRGIGYRFGTAAGFDHGDTD